MEIQYHGGIEHYIYASPLLQKMCRVMAQCGADFVTCQHSHCIGTREKYAGCEILYGQGNTLFGCIEGREDWNRGLLAEITLGENAEIRYIPITATPEGEQLLNTAEADKLLRHLEVTSVALSDTDFVEEQFRQFCIRQADSYLPMAFGWGRWRNKLNRILHGRLIRLCNTLSARRTAMNLIRCDAHKEVLQTILEQNTRQ